MIPGAAFRHLSPSSSEEGRRGGGDAQHRARSAFCQCRYTTPKPPPLKKRGLPVGLLLLLAACSAGEGGDPLPEGEPVFCALAGSQQFKDQCRVERSTVDGAKVIVVRHPDGGFRRLEVSQDGQNLLAADGADQSQSALKGDRYEVILGDDRYVIPATPPAAGDAQPK